tara:strand:+ start:1935 stop:2462 length:528 start_codon:yes stop_codon:yes gene_type:complete
VAAARPGTAAPASARGAKPATGAAKPAAGSATARPMTARDKMAAKKKEEEEKKADMKKPSTATPARTAGKASVLKPAAKGPAAAKAKAPPGVKVTKEPLAAKSDWWFYLKASGGPFPKEVKEAKLAECKVKFDAMKEEDNDEYKDLTAKAQEDTERFDKEMAEFKEKGFYMAPKK